MSEQIDILKSLSLAMPALATPLRHSPQMTAKYVAAIEHAILLESQLVAANERVKELKDAIIKQENSIQQTLGKALGYPWFKDDQRNFPGATEESGVCVGEHVAETLAEEAAVRIKQLTERAVRAEEAVAIYERQIKSAFDTKLRDSINAELKQGGRA